MLDLKNIKLSDSTIKIAISIGIIILAFLIFIWLIYIPHKHALDMLKAEVQATDRDILAIKAQAGAGESLETAIEGLRKYLARLENKFPSKEEVALRELSALAQKSGIDITSMSPMKKQPVKDIGNKPISIEGYRIEELNVAIDITAGYRSVGEYIRMLKDDCPVFIRINNITMSGGGSPGLRVNLVITVYLLSKAA